MVHQKEKEGGKGLSLVGAARWHVTLRFLGQVGEERVPELVEALAAAAGAFSGPLRCQVGPETGWFVGTRVLQLPVVGLDPLADAVMAATTAAVPAQRDDALPFNGHLTLARLRGRRRGVSGRMGRTLGGVAFGAAFDVDSIDLVHSEPSPNGHVYSTLFRAQLGAGGDLY